jgi:transcriptional regulator with XRE-family HTH domain
MRRNHTYSPQTVAAAKALGLEIARARRERRQTVADLAERVGVSVITLRNVERGVPTVALGTYFEVATLVGVELLGASGDDLSRLVERGRERLAVLPARVRRPSRPVRDDF